ncbi:hypothetical protein SERLA73DRAFT_118517 [Serpula lacrymans var. lacrymans S7.3]|uniref:non-specific serine/threonine protein kinase n=1 Tax=Serpula lacrymans var. lacrymans (strain S7.3) TaxID=936435 RepID=F8PG68_SERL3|nr:hypothetical protein SERLA73DRAFT_118517 [Serpula lacrymans var. lacrymans S7.3]
MLNHEDVAIKLEAGNTSSTHLWREAQIYERLGGCIGFPKLYWYGSHEDDNVMVIDLLGASLEQVLNLCGLKFSLKTVLMLLNQMESISRIQTLHSYYLIHRDLKPENFLLGVNGSAGILHLIDLGLSTKNIHSITGEHIPYKDGQKLVGTIHYLSCNAHMGSKEKKYRHIKKKKLHTMPAALCHGLFKEFHDFLLYTCLLAYDQDPDYHYIHNLFCVVFKMLLHKDWSWLHGKSKKTGQWCLGTNVQPVSTAFF